MQWLKPTMHEPDWHYVDGDGRIFGEVHEGPLGWNWTAYAYRGGHRRITAQGGAEKSCAVARSRVENASH